MTELDEIFSRVYQISNMIYALKHPNDNDPFDHDMRVAIQERLEQTVINIFDEMNIFDNLNILDVEKISYLGRKYK